METTTIGFIGLGLIGGSIAKAFRKFHPEYRLLAYSATSATLDYALEENIIDEALTARDNRFGDCDYIFLCAPVDINIQYLSYLKEVMKPGCILTDVGSVKGEIHQAVTKLGLDHCFIGGHPMAGSEKTGVRNATDYLVENAYYIITPGSEVSLLQLGEFIEIVQSIGAIPMVLNYEEHDYITAAVSHLPHIVAASLVNLIHNLDTPDKHMRTVAAGGFKDITRIASSSPDMWQPICMENKKQISKVLDEYIRLLVQARCWVDGEDSDDIYQMFEKARDYRDTIPDGSSGTMQKTYYFYCDIYDEAGGIATIATMLATNNISIKNIGIIHNREFGEGVLRIEFYDQESCDTAIRILTERNYTLHFR